jgi:hypothetical protein
MSGMIKRLLVMLIFSICILSLSLHFIVEGLGGVQDHFVGYQRSGMMDAHDGDQFLLSESGPANTAQTVPHALVPSALHLISHPLPAPFHPPKSS